jgi:hypothetical protein
MVADNPGIPAGNDNAAAKVAADLEAALKRGHEGPALDRWRQEVYRHTDPNERQAFVNAVQQQLKSKGYHVPEADLSHAPQAASAQAARPRIETPQQSQSGAPKDLLPADWRRDIAQSEAARTQAAQYGTPLRGSLPPETVQGSKLAPLPQTQIARYASPTEQAQRTASNNNVETQEADRIVQGAAQLKKQGLDNQRIQEYVEDETSKIYKQHPDWMNANSPQSFIQQMNRGFQKEHIYSERKTTEPRVQHRPSRVKGRTEGNEEHTERGQETVGHAGQYTVKHGDTLEAIARRTLGDEHKDDTKYSSNYKEVLEEEKKIREINKGHDLDRHMKVGDKLTIPGYNTTAAPTEIKPPAAETKPPAATATIPPKAEALVHPSITPKEAPPKPPAVPTDADRKADDAHLIAIATQALDPKATEIRDINNNKLPPTPENRLKVVRETVDQADTDAKANKADPTVRLQTRQQLVLTLIDPGAAQTQQQQQINKTEATKIVGEMDRIGHVLTDPAWPAFQKAVEANSIDPRKKN